MAKGMQRCIVHAKKYVVIFQIKLQSTNSRSRENKWRREIICFVYKTENKTEPGCSLWLSEKPESTENQGYVFKNKVSLEFKVMTHDETD